MDINYIARKIADKRRMKKKTQEQLGEELGVSGQAVSKWEKGESLPDIMILPKLCETLNISLDEFFGVQKSTSETKESDILREFCTYAEKKGRASALLEASSRLYYPILAAHDGILLGSEDVIVSNKKGLSFALSGDEFQQFCYNDLSFADIDFIEALKDQNTMIVLKSLKRERAVTEEEIIAESGMNQNAVDHIILELLKRDIIFHTTDHKGKDGYMFSTNAVALWICLAGIAVSKENFKGHVWVVT